MSNQHDTTVTQIMLISLLAKDMATKLNDRQLWPDDYQSQVFKIREILDGLPRSIR